MSPAGSLLATKKMIANLNAMYPGAIVELGQTDPSWLYVYLERGKIQARWTFVVYSATEASATGVSHDGTNDPRPIKKPAPITPDSNNGFPAPILTLLSTGRLKPHKCWAQVDQSIRDWLANPK